jgi:hypothetical protein
MVRVAPSARVPGNPDPPICRGWSAVTFLAGVCRAISEPTMERTTAGGRVIDDKAPVAVSLAFRGYLLPVLVDI